MYRKIGWVIVMGVWLISTFKVMPMSVSADTTPVYYLTSPYCAVCQDVDVFLSEHPDLKEVLVAVDVTKPADAQQLKAIQEQAGITSVITPMFVRGADTLTGFNPSVKQTLGEWTSIPLMIDDPLADIDTSHWSGITVMTVMLGLVDGVNPCSIWALLFLMTMMVTRKYTKKEMLWIGHVYILTLAVIYGLFIAGLSFVTGDILNHGGLKVAVFLIAGIMGVANILTAFNVSLPVTFSISDKHKKTYIKLAGKKLKNKASIYRLTLTAVTVGLFASLIELPCTAGFPILWNGYMHELGAGWGVYVLYLMLYLSMYVLMEWLLLVGFVVSMKKLLLTEKAGASLKLGSGMLMVWLGIAFVIGKPWAMDVLCLGVVMLMAVGVSIVHYCRQSK